ncbi:hypothetical protein RRG08_003017, partial [Elysia crispata]
MVHDGSTRGDSSRFYPRRFKSLLPEEVQVASTRGGSSLFYPR